MALNVERLNAAVASVAAGLEAVAAAIRNPAVDNNSQQVIDDIAGTLEAMAATLPGLVAEENAEDGVVEAPVEETPSE